MRDPHTSEIDAATRFIENRGNKETTKASVLQRAGTVISMTTPKRLGGGVSLWRSSDTERESVRKEREEAKGEGQVPATPVKHFL